MGFGPGHCFSLKRQMQIHDIWHFNRLLYHLGLQEVRQKVHKFAKKNSQNGPKLRLLKLTPAWKSMLAQVVAVVTNISYANIIWYDGVLSKGPGGTIKGFITLGDSRCLSTFPLQVHAIFCMQPVQMTDVLPRDWSLLSWNLERRHCTQAQIRNIIPRTKGRGF